MLPALDDAAVGQWCRAAVAALSAARGRIDDLNVFPVPDGDTGTNLLATAEAAVAALDEPEDGGTESAWALLARGAVLGARGNSGTILAQLWRGLADQLAGQPPADGPTFAAALQKAADTAYGAVADPEEGTFLTVARAGAEAAVAAGHADLGEVVRAAADGARTALEATPGQLTVLRDAGVVDAGGAGLCLVLDALVTTVTGVEPDRPSLARRSERGQHHAHDHGDLPHQPPAGPGSEVQYLLADSDEAAVARLQERLAALGDSLVVVGVDTPGGREWNVHVHVSDVGEPAVGDDRDDRTRAGVRRRRPDRGQRGHRDAVRPAGLDAGLDGCADVPDVHVHVPPAARRPG